MLIDAEMGRVTSRNRVLRPGRKIEGSTVTARWVRHLTASHGLAVGLSDGRTFDLAYLDACADRDPHGFEARVLRAVTGG